MIIDKVLQLTEAEDKRYFFAGLTTLVFAWAILMSQSSLRLQPSSQAIESTESLVLDMQEIVEPLPNVGRSSPQVLPVPSLYATTKHVEHPVATVVSTETVAEAPVMRQLVEESQAANGNEAVSAPVILKNAASFAGEAVPTVQSVATNQNVANPALNRMSIENEFTAQIRAHLNAAKRYPTGREASLQRPQGKVKVGFVLGRSGNVVAVDIEDSSGSNLLDATALTTVRRARYAAFPENAWLGEEQHRFSVELNFVPPN